MLTILISINTLIFIAIALLHLYWVVGGTWALEGAMPEQYKADFFNPKYKTHSKIATFTVAMGLFIFAFITIAKLSFIEFPFLNWHTYLIYAIGIVFIIRGIGDFNLFGLFRQKNTTDVFTKRDKLIYTPLCLFIGITMFLITLL